MLTRNQLVAAAGLGSLALLAGAFGFQYIGGLAPCQLCLWQRWPHAAAIVIMLAALVLPGRILPVLGILAALATAGVGMFHVGVEQMWWEGLASCSGNSIAGLNVSDLLNPNVAIAAPIRCDAIAWSLFGISMAGWNVIVSLGLAVLWLMAARKPA
jgi:disulfide bond formation protein DsbB